MNHLNVLEEVSRAYTRRVMTNVHRSAYVEAMVFLALRDSGWRRMDPWELWDLERDCDRLEVKQAAAAQAWGGFPPSSPRFDIAPRSEHMQGNQLVYKRGRTANIYLFAWHGEDRGIADQRDPTAWEFYVVPEGCLPPCQKTIGLTPLSHLSTPCRIEHLAGRVSHAQRPA